MRSKEIESLKKENMKLHRILDEINAMFWNNFMIKDMVTDVDLVREKLCEKLNKWAEID